jgi:ammonia channel protein AmtB
MHGVGGVLAVLLAGPFSRMIDLGPGGIQLSPHWDQLGPQLIGIVVCLAWSFAASAVVFMLIKYTPGLTVRPCRNENEAAPRGRGGLTNQCPPP